MASGDTKDIKEKKPETVVETKESTSQELGVKHPLQNKWAWWFYKNDKSKDWESNLRLVTTFDTVEDFWALYNHIKQAGKLPSGCDYCVFKDGIKPMWEDDRNKNGGRWLINNNKTRRHDILDELWVETLLCLIGEAFDEHSDNVCGAVIQIRPKMDKLAIWTADANNQDGNMRIGQTIKGRLHKHLSKQSIGFQAHVDTMTRTGSTTKNRYSV